MVPNGSLLAKQNANAKAVLNVPLRYLKQILIISVTGILAWFVFFALSSTNGTAVVGTIDASKSHYAWSTNYGWVNFAPDQGNIQVSDSSLSGYAWAQNLGWINLYPTNSNQGVTNDGEGHLDGFAWAAGVGWIDFSHVTIAASGKFTGYAYSQFTGQISFDCSNCDVETDWRPRSSRSSTGANEPGSGGWFIHPPPQEALPVPTEIPTKPVSAHPRPNQPSALLATSTAILAQPTTTATTGLLLIRFWNYLTSFTPRHILWIIGK